MDISDLIRQSSLFSTRRLPSLYADFRRLKHTNEEGYQANVAAWKSILQTAITTGEVFDDKLCIKADNELLDCLSNPDHGRPQAIDAVIDEMVSERQLIPLHEFFAHGVYSWRWGVGASVSWALRTTGLWDSTWKAGDKTGKIKPCKYVHVGKLEDLATQALDLLKSDSYSSSVFTRSMVDKLMLDNMGFSATDIDVLLTYLTRDRPRVKVKNKVVKVGKEEVTEQDVAVANMRETLTQVSERVDSLSVQIDQCTERAKLALGKNNKVLARYALKSKKLALDTQASSLDMLTNLEQVLVKIDSASGHLEIVNALQSGVGILGQLNQQIGGVEKVGELMDEIKDQSAETDAIGLEISQLAGDVDEDEIDQELKDMETQETEDKLGKAGKAPTSDIDELVAETEKLHVQEKHQPEAVPN